MNRNTRMLTAALAVLMVGACTGKYVESTTATDGAAGNGYYALPRLFVSLNVTYGPEKDAAAPVAPATKTKKAKKTKAAKATPAKPTYVYKITVNDPVYAPDAEYRYLVKLDHTAFSDDQIKVDTDAKGLLTGINATDTDKSGTVVTKVVELGASIAKAVAVMSGEGALFVDKVTGAPDCSKRKPDKPFSKDFLFDPSDPQQIEALQLQLCDLGILFDSWQIGSQTDVVWHPKSKLQEALATLKGDEKPDATPPKPRAAGAACDKIKAICFRPAVPFNFVLEVPVMKGKDPSIETHKYFVIAPDRSMTLGIDFARVPLNTTSVTVVFSNGMLTSVSTNKPSEVVAALQVPIDAANAIAAIPGQILTVKVTDAAAAANLAAQQDALLKTQAQMLADLKALRDAQKPSTAGTGQSGSGTTH